MRAPAGGLVCWCLKLNWVPKEKVDDYRRKLNDFNDGEIWPKAYSNNQTAESWNIKVRIQDWIKSICLNFRFQLFSAIAWGELDLKSKLCFHDRMAWLE